MRTLLDIERDKYQDVWTSIDTYADYAPGAVRVPMFLDMAFREFEGRMPSEFTVLDAGCGSAKGGLALSTLGFHVTLCDVTPAGIVTEAQHLPYHDACLWTDLSPLARGVGHPGRTRFDVVYCCDVLEHVPPQFTMLAIDQMLRVARHGLFLSISLQPDNFGAWIGEPLHQTVMPFTWWRDSIRELGDLVEARDLQKDGVFFVRHR